ncbi:alpha/beta fold hydrolase [Streptomyces griseoincarnatus]|uniref:Hydrolase n=2 Tax=Streptomyces TaxID=1883 RepID=A0ABQ2TYM8_9ACTN|nr:MULTISPECIES: alpha/beta hydrolase [Streptomyces]MDH3036089.1 alpha/beta hydrolase [Streptomyces sp. TRM75561]MQL61313.1 alpha/beta hydrolase [Streptomyces vinaceus]GGP31418.1 hydrolase [Streptomyces griseoincarnatus]GGT47476.1 hydrolase [Streptomyces variabilis]
MAEVRHRFTTVQGHRVFYREAGPADAPTVVLLHGYPTSSRMFRHLLPALADRFHVIAPDHLGFGQSATPPATDFDYTFDALAEVTEDLLGQLGVERYAVYVQDYGAPIGWRLALRNPDAITAIVSQNGNAYDEGFVPEFWAPVWAYAQSPGPSTEAALRGALSEEAIRWQYTHGVAEPELVDPDTWATDHREISRPGLDQIQLDLFRDYATNPPLYPRLHEYFRASQVPLLAIWGAEDEIFGPDGARAFAKDLENAQIQLVPGGGHFLLESHLDTVTDAMRTFLGQHLSPRE